MRAQPAACALLLLLLSACGAPRDEAASTTTESTSPTATPATTTAPPATGCADNGEFVEYGEVARIDQDPSDATTIGVISWDETEACEVFTFAFVTSEGAPATTPPGARVAFPEGTPILRIALDADQTVIADQLVETALVSRLYVVRALDGGMFIDLHLASPAQARAGVSSSPARLTLHLQPGIVEHPTTPATSDSVVVASPLDGAAAEASVEVGGYARAGETEMAVIAAAGDEVVAETAAAVAGPLDTWGEFRAALELPAGDVSVFVGHESPADGGLDGVTIRLSIQ